MKYLIMFFVATFAAVATLAADIKPVLSWPAHIVYNGYAITRPSVGTCVKAGCRLINTMTPVAPVGTRIIAKEIVQDPADPTRCKWELVTEALPAPVAPKPVGTVTVAVDRVQCVFTTNGMYRGMIWLDAPVAK